MGRTSLICTVIATCAVVVTATCLAGSSTSPALKKNPNVTVVFK